MCIQTADVTKVICLFYQKLFTIIANDQYGISCNESELLKELKQIIKQYEFGCFSNDYIRNLVLEEGGDLDLCTRDTFVETPDGE